MRQPFCGWLLAAAVVSAASAAQACPTEMGLRSPQVPPCSSAAKPSPPDDATCCHVPDLWSAAPKPRVVIAARADVPAPQPNTHKEEQAK